MKKFFLFSVIFTAVLMASCSGNKKTETAPSAHESFVSELSSQDTAAVTKLCEDFLQAMKDDDKDKAFGILRAINDGQVVAPTSQQMAKLSTQFTLFPVKNYHLKDFKIGDATDNICSYSIVFDIDEDGKESAINFGFCPVKVDGQWYITVRNASAELPQ